MKNFFRVWVTSLSAVTFARNEVKNILARYANERMESNITPFTDCPPLVKKLDQCQLYFERGSDGRSKNIYKWVSPEYNANRQKMNHPKISKEKPYNRKYGPPMNYHQYWVQNFKKSDGSRGHLKWVYPDSDSCKRKIKDSQHRDQEQIIYINGPSSQFVISRGVRSDLKWINSDYNSNRRKTNGIKDANA
ncbi:uncharacterized protein LOC112694385 [Sipha flava]|uniref:Uncharacterized protein LOC112694385 n=1 Tax=Sipha flava TaxID=143950 RepID=A0A8B8GSK7_9HEMI|nr:uncharacterized protein LOC112694385 [Sipha flava]